MILHRARVYKASVANFNGQGFFDWTGRFWQPNGNKNKILLTSIVFFARSEHGVKILETKSQVLNSLH